MHRQCVWGIWMEGDFVLLDRGERCAHDRHSILDSERIQLAAQMYSTVYVKAGNGVPSILPVSVLLCWSNALKLRVHIQQLPQHPDTGSPTYAWLMAK